MPCQSKRWPPAAPGGFRREAATKISVQWTPEAALAYMDRRDIAAQIVSMPLASREHPTTQSSAPASPG